MSKVKVGKVKVRQKPYHLDSFIKHLFFNQLFMLLLLALGIFTNRYVNNFWSFYNLIGVIPYILSLAVFGWASWFIEPYNRFYPPKKLVTEGPYRYTRNPLSLVTMVMILSTALISGSFFVLSAAPIFVLYATLRIYSEEKQLAKHFGKAYEDYCKKTKRWL